ncbi:hypothetical protein VP1G_02644 [Cytospora mali]|uniref:Heterokaryon incompatibility domain-containing protein n=1 Tax=Cytospora mali TaxID=578113 RepID=A0A194UUB0_CYTMA|nr:hypothetical protein VP1G_02644 [Valsa mali var. pyri (nom. inval.)]
MAHKRDLQRRPSTSQSSEFTFSEGEQESTTDDSHDLHTDSDESLLGGWPRRLLHVDRERDVFTSYEWEPGNIYGGHKEPKYNVISYTWGRYTLQDGTRPEVKGIDIGGVTWAIPRIDPDKHFSVADFRAAIKTACATHENSSLKDVQFVWLDVACIDQEKYGLKMLEVGRQAVIFQHAESSFIWLASSLGQDLQLVISELWDASNNAPAPDMAANARHVVLMEKWLENWLERSLQSVEYILEREPWFTSLWTLQEAYLRPFAVMSKATTGKI